MRSPLHTKSDAFRIAAIDLGSNSAHLVIAEADRSGNFRVLDNEKIFLRLARELDAERNLSDNGIRAAVAAFRQMKEIASAYTTNIRAVATFATREARNHGVLLARIKRETGIDVEIIDGLEEARLEFLGVQQGLPIHGVDCLLVDIGGGSTEVMIANGKTAKFRFVDSVSLGAVTFTKAFHGEKKPTKGQLKKLEDAVDVRLKSIRPRVKDLRFDRAIASSGTAKALATICAKVFEGDDLSDPNGYVFSVDDLKVLYKEFCRLGDPKSIRAAFGIELRRAEIILAGTEILLGIAKVFHVKEWMVSTYSLREGLVVDTFLRLGRKINLDTHSMRMKHVLAFADHFSLDRSFAENVSETALSLYDGFVKYGKNLGVQITDNERELLEFASYLCEVGKSINYPRYHKHSSYILANNSMMGFTQDEKQIKSHIVRFHRRSLATKEKALSCPILLANLRRINFLALCLRLATSLNRTRRDKVQKVTFRKLKRNQLVMTIICKGSLKHFETEFAQAQQDLPVIEKFLGLELIVRVLAKR